MPALITNRPKTIAGVLVLAALVVWLVFFLAGKARAAETCVGFDMPPDVTMICHAPSGMWVYDSSVWSRYLPTGVRFLKQS